MGFKLNPRATVGFPNVLLSSLKEASTTNKVEVEDRQLEDEPETERAAGRVVIELTNIGHFFEKNGEPFEVLRDINLTIVQNEFIALVGPSGCGKSTLLFIIAGFLHPTQGKVLHNNRPVDGPGRARGVVFQADAVFPWLTVYQNIEFGLKTKGTAKNERELIVRKYIRLVELEGSEKLYPKQLSGGMRKRVDVARTFASEPDVLLMDESFGSLDTQTKENLQLALLDLWERERKTAVFVTHDIEEAIFLADRVLIMSRNPGQIVEAIEIPFGRPRRPELKVSPELQQLRARIQQLLSAD
jgi:NitT/TauT family transport system ATP-binding protein